MAAIDSVQEEYVLEPDAVMTIPLSSDVNQPLIAHVNSQQYDLEPNSAYYFSLAPGGIGLRKVEFGQPEHDSQAADAAPGVLAPPADVETAEPTEVISLKLLVDDEQRENSEKSNQRLSKRLQAASEIIRQHCGIRFEVRSFERWESDDRIKDLTELQRDFQRKVEPKPAWLAIGFTSQHRAPRGSTQWKEGLKPLCTHILMSDWVDQTTEMERVELLVHALGRYLGGVENPEPKSVMRPAVGDYQARVRTFSLVFDPANALAINLMAEQIRRRGVRNWPDLSDHAKSQLSDIYSRIGKSDLWAESHPGFANVFRQLAAPKYSTGKVDGSFVAGVDVGERDDSGDLVRLALDDPVRWFRREDLPPPKTPAAYVEFVGGDRLPGKVVGYQAEAAAAPGLPRHLIVQTPESLTWSGRSEGKVQIRERWLRRIVWEAPKERQYRPGALYTRDGRELYFHMFRLLDEAVQILQESGVVRIPFGEIAELHFPKSDPWQAYFEQLAILTPECDRRLMQLETAGGGRFTASSARFQVRPPRPRENRKDSLYVVQPAWSYDPLWINKYSVCLHQFFRPDEVPLSSLPPTVLDRPDAGTQTSWSADRNVEGEVLRVAKREFTWGLSGLGQIALCFELPACARCFQSMVGLDNPGDFEGKICVNATAANGSNALFEKAIQNGSDEVLNTGLLQLQPSSSGPRQLTLLSDSGSSNPGPATTSDMPGMINWVEPILLLDTEQLLAEVGRNAVGGVSAWSGWQVSPVDAVRLRNRWDTVDVEAPRYRVEAVPTGPSITLSRDLQVTSKTSELVLVANGLSEEETSSITIQVRANGTTVATRQVGANDDRKPWAVNLGEYAGENATIDVVMISNGDGVSLDWSLLEIVDGPLP